MRPAAVVAGCARRSKVSRGHEQAGAGPGAAEAVPRAIRHAIDLLVVAHQSNIDLSGDDRVNAVRRSMLEQCPDTVESDDLLHEVIIGVCESASWEPPNIIDGVEAELDRLKQRGLKLAVVSNTGSRRPAVYVEQALRRPTLRPAGSTLDMVDDVLSWKPGQAISRHPCERESAQARRHSSATRRGRHSALGTLLPASVLVVTKLSGNPCDIRVTHGQGLTAALDTADHRG